MRRFIFIFVVLGLCGHAYGSDNPLKAYISSPEITALFIKNDDTTVNYSFITSKNPDKMNVTIGTSLLEGSNFLVDSKNYNNIPVFVESYNPLVYSVKFDNKEEKDPVFETGKFFDTLSGYKGVLGAAGRDAASAKFTLRLAYPKKGGNSETIVVEAEVPQECSALMKSYVVLLEKVKCGDDEKACKETGLLVTKDDVANWAKNTNSESGIKNTITEIEAKSKTLQENVDIIKKIRNKIEEANSDTVCPGVPVNVLSEVSFVMDRASEAVAQRELMKKYLDSLSAHLKKYQNDWIGKYYKIESIQSPLNDKMITSTVKITKYQYTTESSSLALVEKAGSKNEAHFTLHRKEKVIIEPGIAVVYTGLTYKLFSTNTVNGTQVVAKTEKTDPFHAAVVLNFLPTALANEVISPFVQIGLSEAKEYPAFMTGVGGRLFDKPLAFAFGCVFGFSHELDSLHEGSVVSGQAEIDKDVNVGVVPSWYLAVQYNF